MERVCLLVRNDCRTDFRVLKEAKSLADTGYDVTIVGINTYGPLEKESRDGFKIVRVPVKHEKLGILKAINLFPKAMWRMARTASILSADVYHAQDSSAILPTWLAVQQVKGAKFIYDAHEVGFYSLRDNLALLPFPWGFVGWIWSLVNDWIVRHKVDVVIAVNDVLADIQAKHYGISHPKIVMNCPPSLKARLNSGNVLADTIAVSHETPIVICQGMFSLARGDGPGLENLIRSAALLDRGVIVLLGNVGTAREFEPLRKLAQSEAFQGKVFILPPVPTAELLSYTSGAKIGVIPLQLPGLLRYALPNKFFEYISVGLPVVTSNIPPVSRLCDEYQCGLICDPDSPQSIADAINHILADDNLYKQMQVGASQVSRIYNWETQEAVLLDVYRELLSQT